MAMLKQDIDNISDNLNSQFHPVFTLYKIANDILNDYRTQLKECGITLLVEGEGFCKTTLSDEDFGQMLKDAMEMASEEARRMDENRGSYVRVRSMCAQKKFFLKIEYSSEHDQSKKHERFMNIEELIARKGGYVEIKNNEEVNVLMIALSIAL